MNRIGMLVVPLLAAYLYLGGCKAGKGVVFGVKAWGVSISAAWCSAS